MRTRRIVEDMVGAAEAAPSADDDDDEGDEKTRAEEEEERRRRKKEREDRLIQGEDKPMDPATLPDGEPEIEIESLIIPAVKGLHDKHVQAVAARNKASS